MTTELGASAFARFIASDLAKMLGKVTVTALVAGVTASFGFWTTWQGLQGQVSAQARQLEAVERFMGAQDKRLDALEERAVENEKAIAVALESMRSIDRNVALLRDDFRDLRRDLTGRMTP